MTISNISSKATGPIVTRFHAGPSGTEGMKIHSNRSVHITSKATTPIHGKNILKIFNSRTKLSEGLET